jgi:soluble lytic murein transglycosylase
MQQAFRKGDRKSSNSCCPSARPRAGALGRLLGAEGPAGRRQRAGSAGLPAALRRHLPGRPPAQRLAAAAGPAPRLGQFAEYPQLPHARRPRGALLRAADRPDQGHGQPATLADEVRRNWYASATPTTAAPTLRRELHQATKSSRHQDLWRKARLAMEANRPRAARAAVEIVAPESLPQLKARDGRQPSKYLPAAASARARCAGAGACWRSSSWPWATPTGAARSWTASGACTSRRRAQLGLGRDRQAGGAASCRTAPWAIFPTSSRDSDLNDDLLGWKVRAALRAGQWKAGAPCRGRHERRGRQDPTWVYWKARALLAGRQRPSAPKPGAAGGIASTRAFTNSWRWKSWASASPPPAPRAADGGGKRPPPAPTPA